MFIEDISDENYSSLEQALDLLNEFGEYTVFPERLPNLSKIRNTIRNSVLK